MRDHFLLDLVVKTWRIDYWLITTRTDLNRQAENLSKPRPTDLDLRSVSLFATLKTLRCIQQSHQNYRSTHVLPVTAQNGFISNLAAGSVTSKKSHPYHTGKNAQDH